MKPHDSVQHWRGFSLSHSMGEGRGEGFSAAYLAVS